ncbi:hypothetical protein LCGC14_3032220 [marine sediment metagenome]|uniref:Uncharacterized protein n=1 Tax=marine sediment metagenome TaxID=412755 RepID=A0A0F8XF94_9ZZZZ
MRQPTRWKLLAATLIVLLGCASGCWRQRTRTVLIPPGEPVQLAEPIEAYIYVDGVKSENRVMLPGGWWVLPEPEDD